MRENLIGFALSGDVNGFFFGFGDDVDMMLLFEGLVRVREVVLEERASQVLSLSDDVYVVRGN